MRFAVESRWFGPVLLVGDVRQGAARLAEALRELGLAQVIAINGDAIRSTLKTSRPRAIILVEPLIEAADRTRDRILRCLGEVVPPIIWCCSPIRNGFSQGFRAFDAIVDGQSQPELLYRRVCQLIARAWGSSHSKDATIWSIHAGEVVAANRNGMESGRPFQDLVRLIYVSRSMIQSGDADETRELRNILVAARAHNRSVDITGGLVRVDSYFIQVLEGPNAAVQTLMDRIKADGRHFDVLVRALFPINTRSFARWSMACADIRPDDRDGTDSGTAFRPYQASPADLLAFVEAAILAGTRLAVGLEVALAAFQGKVCVPL